MSFYMTGGLAEREFNEIITAADLKSRPPYDWNERRREKIGPRFGSRRTITSVFLTDARERKAEAGVCARMRNTSEASGLRITIAQHPRSANDVIAKGLSPAGVYVYVAEIRSLNSTWGVSGFLLC